MSNGYAKSAPWWAMWASGLLAQFGLGLAQWLSYKSEGGTTMILGLAALQAIVGVSMTFGPAAAGMLAGRVGQAVKTKDGE